MTRIIPATPMVDLYNALHAKGVSRQQKLDRADALAADPQALADAFGDSVAAIERYLPRDEGFYRSRRHYAVGEVKAASTTDLALRIRDAGGLTFASGPIGHLSHAGRAVRAVDARSLSCEYLDRELVATRTTGSASHDGKAVRLDLLLANGVDRIPIVAEVKRTSDANAKSTDKDPFSALVQALACVSQLATPAQYTRLARRGAAVTQRSADVPGPADIAHATPPVFDVYVVLHNRPGGTHQAELAAATERLAVGLLASAPVARHVRRIACVLTRLERDALLISADWAYERAVPATTAIEATFARYFASCAITLPSAVCLRMTDGALYARSWSIRWRWRETALEFRASNRMTNERWHVIKPDGTLTNRHVPSEMIIFGPDDSQAQLEDENAAAWRAHGQTVSDSGMDLDMSLPDHAWADEPHLRWKLDGENGWNVLALPPRPHLRPARSSPPA